MVNVCDYSKNRQLWMEIFKRRGLMACIRCGYNKCFAAIHLHHRDPKKKKFTISSLMSHYPSEKLLLELEKCDPLCANCHAELHAEQGRDLRSSPVKHIPLAKGSTMSQATRRTKQTSGHSSAFKYLEV